MIEEILTERLVMCWYVSKYGEKELVRAASQLDFDKF